MIRLEYDHETEVVSAYVELGKTTLVVPLTLDDVVTLQWEFQGVMHFVQKQLDERAALPVQKKPLAPTTPLLEAAREIVEFFRRREFDMTDTVVSIDDKGRCILRLRFDYKYAVFMEGRAKNVEQYAMGRNAPVQSFWSQDENGPVFYFELMTLFERDRRNLLRDRDAGAHYAQGVE